MTGLKKPAKAVRLRNVDIDMCLPECESESNIDFVDERLSLVGDLLEKVKDQHLTFHEFIANRFLFEGKSEGGMEVEVCKRCGNRTCTFSHLLGGEPAQLNII